MKSVLAECDSCGGTGLYEGMCERKGEPVVCLSCNGTGCNTIHFKPFERRRGKRGVKVVRVSRGGFIATGVGGIPSTEMTYQEFLTKHVPPKV